MMISVFYRRVCLLIVSWVTVVGSMVPSKADITSGQSARFFDVNPGTGTNVSYLVLDESSLSLFPLIFAWHYNGAINPATGTNWSGTDLFEGIQSALTGSVNQLAVTSQPYGTNSYSQALITGFSFGSSSSTLVDPYGTNVWTYWIEGGSMDANNEKFVGFTFDAPTTNWVIAPNTSDTRWISNGSCDGWTISGFAYTGTSNDICYYTDTQGLQQPVDLGIYQGVSPLSMTPLPIPVATNPTNAVPVPPVVTGNPSNQSITFPALSSCAYGAGPFQLTATASSGLSVSYVSSKTNVAVVNGTQVQVNGVGSTVITASQSGNLSWNASPPVSRTLTVGQGSQTIGFSTLSPVLYGSTPISLSAIAGSGLAVSYASSNTKVARIINGTQVQVNGVGSTVITASQSGNSLWSAASSVRQTLVVGKGIQQLTFDPAASITLTGGHAKTFGLTASSSTGLPVSFSSSKVSVISLSGANGARATARSAGRAIITVTQKGNSLWQSAAVSKEITVQ